MSRATAAADGIDPEALQAAMTAHPVVVDAIERISRRARAAEADRDTALQERDAARRDHKGALAQLEVTKGALAGFVKAFDGQPPIMPARATEPTQEEIEKIVADMSPAEKALVLMKATPARRFGIHSEAPAVANVFGR